MIDDIIDSIVINNEVILAAGPFQRANTSKFFSQTILNADIWPPHLPYLLTSITVKAV